VQHGRPQGGGETGICPPSLEIETKYNFFRKHEVRKSIPINWFNFATSIYLPVWHSQCTRFSSFTSPLVSLQSAHVRFFAWPNLGADSFAVGLHCVTITIVGILPHLTIVFRRLAWQVMQRHSNCQYCHSVFPLGCSIALYQQIIRAVKFHSRALATRHVTSLGQ